MRRLAPLLLAATLITPSLITSAHAGTTLPARKAGYWVSSMVMHMNMEGVPSNTDKTPTITAMCTNPAVDLKVMTSTGMAQCSAPNVSGGAPTYTIVMTCQDPMGGGNMTTTTTMTFITDTQMHMESKTSSAHISGGMVSDSKWQGPCPAGWVPGDVGRMENGAITKFANILTPPKLPHAPPGG